MADVSNINSVVVANISKIDNSDIINLSKINTIDIVTSSNPTVNATIDSSLVDSDLTNFPVGIELDATHTILSGLGATDYEGIHFTVNSVECYAEVDVWDMTAEKAVIWVRVPTVLSASDTVIQIEVVGDDNTAYVGVTGSAPAQTVWDSNFLGVWHMSQDPTGGTDCMLDSTSNGHHGTPQGSNYAADDLVDGGFGKAIDFDLPNSADQEGILIAYDPAFELQELMALAFFKQDTASSWDLALSRRNKSAAAVYDSYKIYCYTNKYYWGINDVTSESTSATSIDWVCVVGSYDQINRKLYINGTLEDSTAQTANVVYENNLGVYFADFGQGQEFGGLISEIQIHSSARSDAWVKAVSQNMLGNLVTVA